MTPAPSRPVPGTPDGPANSLSERQRVERRRLPWRDRLAADASRAMWSSVAATCVALPFAPAGRMLGMNSTLAQLVSTYLVVFVVMFAVFPLLTWVGLRRRDSADLARVLTATSDRPRTRWQAVRSFLAASGAHTWGVEIVTLSLGAVTFVALAPALRHDALLIALSALLVVMGWLTMLAAYTTSYARHHFAHGGLEFPGAEPPTATDFLYFAAQVQSTFSGSDVAVTTTSMRAMVTVHSMLSFLFSTVVVALLVSAMLGIA